MKGFGICLQIVWALSPIIGSSLTEFALISLTYPPYLWQVMKHEIYIEMHYQSNLEADDVTNNIKRKFWTFCYRNFTAEYSSNLKKKLCLPPIIMG